MLGLFAGLPADLGIDGGRLADRELASRTGGQVYRAVAVLRERGECWEVDVAVDYKGHRIAAGGRYATVRLEPEFWGALAGAGDGPAPLSELQRLSTRAQQQGR